MMEEFVIYAEDKVTGERRDYDTVKGETTAQEEVERLNQVPDGKNYGYRNRNGLGPENPQLRRLM